MHTFLLLVLVFISSNVYAIQPKNCRQVSKNTCDIYSQLGRGINLGNIFEAPYNGAWGERFDERYINEISEHFDSVRIPIRWTNNASLDASAEIIPEFLEQIQIIINSFIEKGLIVIITLQHYNQLYGAELHRGEKKVAEEDVLPRYFSIWNQLSIQFKHFSSRLLFEPLNEPHGKITDNEWQYLISETTNIIRKHDEKRIIIYGPIGWNSVNYLNTLQLPRNDKNVIATIHIYEPFIFTHQGVSYLYTKKFKDITCCNLYQENSIEHKLKLAQNWSTLNGIPLFVGEFGSHKNADRAYRLNYLKTNIELLKKYKLPWFYWSFSSSFGFYDSKTNKWDIEALNILTKKVIKPIPEIQKYHFEYYN